MQWSRLSLDSRFVTKPALSHFQHLHKAFVARQSETFSHNTTAMLTVGCERRRVASEYRWDGLRRGDDPSHPRVVLQVTLGGWGCFERGGRRWTLGPGQAFLAVLPSAHVYWLPEESPGWDFFWFTAEHPYVVERLIQVVDRYPPVIDLAPGSRHFSQCVDLFERTCARRHEDAFAEEAALFDWMTGLERHVHELAHPRSLRQAMLEELAGYTLANLSRSFGIEELAARHGLSRSHYSHRFRAATGLSPAAHVFEVRVAEARRLLREGPEPLKEIAARTGFADANHLCKAFRRHYHLSPGAYRRQFG